MSRTRATALLLWRAEAASASLRHQQHPPQQLYALRHTTPFQTHADAAAAAAAAPVPADAPQWKPLSRTASLLRSTADAAARAAAGPTLSPAGLAGGSSGDGFAGAVAWQGGGGGGGAAAADAGRPHNGNGNGNRALHLAAAQLPLTLQGPSSCVQWDVTSAPMSSLTSSKQSPWASTSFPTTSLPRKGQMWASTSSSAPSSSSSTSPSSSSAPSTFTARSYSASATDSSSTSSPQSSDSNRSSSSSGRGDPSTQQGGGRGRGVFDEDEEEEPVRATRQLVVTASGPDRPGLVSRLTKIVLDCGGNVEQSRMARLAGEFSVIMQLSVDARVPRVAEQLRERLMELQGLQVSTRWSTDDRTAETKPTRKFRRIFLHGADNPGLVYNVTEYLAANRINIENLETATEDAPFGGATLFTMEGVIAMPLAMSTQQLMRHLDVLQSTLGVQIELHNMDPGRRAEDLQEWQERAARPGGVSRYSVLAQREDDEEHRGQSGGGRGRGGDTLI